MKVTNKSLLCCFTALGALLLCSCVHNKDTTEQKSTPTTAELIAKAAADPKPVQPAQLPVRYQNPGFVTANDAKVDDAFAENQDFVIKVGANIRSTRGPQPLWDIMKRLASLKGKSVSWSSDVDQNVLVDVDISADDDYSEAIDNLLRQVDYFHEVKGSTIIIKYKETKTYHVAMPFTNQTYETATGGNILGSGDETSSVEGTIRLDSKKNDFDIWKNIEKNLDAIIATWSTEENTPDAKDDTAEDKTAATDDKKKDDTVTVTRQLSSGKNSYTIDKPVGLITVNAPRPLQEKIASYLNKIKKELYKQVTIEAKIIEVQLQDNSTLGINWNLILKSMSFGGSLGISKDYSKSLTDNINSSITSSTDSTDTRTRTQSRTKSKDYTKSNTSTGTSKYNQGLTIAGADGSISYDDSKSSYEGQVDDSNVLSSVSSVSDTTEQVLGTVAAAGTSAATTAATIITNGASNLASGALSLATFNFDEFIHALSEQGNTSILANPKLSVMNGQPALITVGRNVTYIDSIESDVTTGDNPVVNYTVNTERILSGVGLSITPIIRDDGEIIMTIVPVTSVLEEPIEYRQVGLGEVGLPIINVREMSSMVQVKDGEMLVIGGLISTTESTVGDNLFPGLADVPVLKYLTGYETKVMQKRELIILLRPRIL